MNLKTTSRAMTILVTLAMLFSLFATTAGAAPSVPVTFTILHTNDFHGQLEPSGSNPGMARVAAVVQGVRNATGADADKRVLLVDAGDEMQGSLLSNLGDGKLTGKGIPTIGTYNAMSYDVATFGNHEFDWGQVNLANRTTEALYPYVTANIVKMDGATCAASGWTRPDFADAPYQIFTMGTTDTVKVAFIGVTTTEVPTITVATATAGLCFKDPVESILHYYDEIKAKADVIVVLSHLGYNDGGYGYGLPVTGDQTLAKNLINAGKPVDLIIGGHSHTDLAAQTDVTVPGKTGKTTVVQAHYNGRKVGRADVTVGTDGSVAVAWTKLVVSTSGAEDAVIKDTINSYKTQAYLDLVNTPIGYAQVDLSRRQTVINPGAGTPTLAAMTDNMMGSFINDAIYNYLNTDGEPTNDIDIFFNNAGGIRTDWCWNGAAWLNTGCTPSGQLATPGLLTYGNMFTVLPFGNRTVVGKMTGAQILEVLNFAPNAASGLIQPAGLKFKYFKYTDTLAPGTLSSPYSYAWGAYDVTILDKTDDTYKPLVLTATYNVGTNEFLAPGGGDSYSAFKYMTDVTYLQTAVEGFADQPGDMLNYVNAYVKGHYGTPEVAYKGPNGDGTLDGRIAIDGDGDFIYDGGSEIVPLTVLHHNDSHGNLVQGQYVGYTQLATLINQERAHNPNRSLLLNGGDAVQGDAMMYYFKSAPSGYAADGTPLPAGLQTHPMMAALNSMNYDAFLLGNHEFNFGSDVFKGIFGQAQFPILGANVTDDGRYGLASATGNQGVQPSIEKTLDGINVAVLGLTNHRVPNYELPSNIVGLTFGNPIDKAATTVPALRSKNDVVIALTHIGFTTNPKSVEVDNNVDTNLAAQVPGIDAIIGSHSHTNPASPEPPYKSLPAIVSGPDGKPVVINQAYRYNNTLGEVILGLRAKAGGGYEMVTKTGRYLSVPISTIADPATAATLQPYVDAITLYNGKTVGQTTVAIDTTNAFTEETNGANLQAEASVWELAQHGITDVDFHLSGAMTNKVINAGTLKISDMFAGMPYENSLVVLKMNGPQLKAVLERAYRNYYYYKYYANADPKYGGYSYYTTCMLDINSVGRIYYRDLKPALPDGNNVVALMVNGKSIDFTDATKYYNVSTVNYLAAGSCNFNDGGVSLWPLNQIAHDTQYYVRDAVIDYITAMGTVSPKVEGRLLFGDTAKPEITINLPVGSNYLHSDYLTFSATDSTDGTTPSFASPSGVKNLVVTLDGKMIPNDAQVDLLAQRLGNHTLTVTTSDYYGNSNSRLEVFNIIATVQSLKTSVNRLYGEKAINDAGVRDGLLSKLKEAQMYLDKGNKKAAINSLNAFLNLVKAQSGKHITKAAAALLTADAQYVIANPK